MMAPHKLTDAQWGRWFHPHSEALKRLGLPGEITHDRSRWGRFLGHGYDHESGWTPELLPVAQLHALLSYIQTHFPEDDLSGLNLLMRKADLLPGAGIDGGRVSSS